MWQDNAETCRSYLKDSELKIWKSSFVGVRSVFHLELSYSGQEQVASTVNLRLNPGSEGNFLQYRETLSLSRRILFHGIC